MLNTNKTNLSLKEINLNQKELKSKEIIIGSILITTIIGLGLYFLLKKKPDDQKLQDLQKTDDQNSQKTNDQNSQKTNDQNPQKINNQNLQDSQKINDQNSQKANDQNPKNSQSEKKIKKTSDNLAIEKYFKDFCKKPENKEFFFKIEDLHNKEEYIFKINTNNFNDFINEFFDYFNTKRLSISKSDFLDHEYFLKYFDEQIKNYKTKIFFKISLKKFITKDLFEKNKFITSTDNKSYETVITNSPTEISKEIIKEKINSTTKEIIKEKINSTKFFKQLLEENKNGNINNNKFGFELISNEKENESEFIEKLLEECIEKDLSETERVF